MALIWKQENSYKSFLLIQYYLMQSKKLFRLQEQRFKLCLMKVVDILEEEGSRGPPKRTMY